MAAPDLIWKNGRFGQTSRTDTWWLSPRHFRRLPHLGRAAEPVIHLRPLYFPPLFTRTMGRFR